MKKLINLIVDKGLEPCIVFSFSKRECESYALSLKACDYNGPEEKKQIDEIFSNAMLTLTEEDRALPLI